MHADKNKQTDKPTNRPSNKRAERQTDKLKNTDDRQIYRITDKQTDRKCTRVFANSTDLGIFEQ